MRIRPSSILASSALAALLGCPFEQPGTAASEAAASDDARVIANGPAHDDPVDSASDASWVSTLPGERGASGLRLLMTDAPIDADNVFVTFCGIYVEPVDPGQDERELADSEGEAQDEADVFEGDDSSDQASAGDEPDAELESDDEHESESSSDDGEGEDHDDDHDEDDHDDVEDSESDEDDQDDAEEAEDESEADEDRGSEGGRGGWLTVTEECQTLDLLTLRNGVTEAVGVASLPAGEYGRIRLMLTDASIVIGGVEHELTVPSGAESGIKIEGGFSLSEGEATTITIDFDAGRSVHYAPGNGYMISPVIQIVDVDSASAPESDEAADERDSAEDMGEAHEDESERLDREDSDERERADEAREDEGRKADEDDDSEQAEGEDSEPEETEAEEIEVEDSEPEESEPEETEVEETEADD